MGQVVHTRQFEEALPREPAGLIPGAPPEEGGGLGVEEYLGILRRRKVALLLPIVVLFAASAVVAYSFPPLYRSKATILIEQQEIPPDLVRSTVMSYAEERIQNITKLVLTTANLLKIAEKFDLYPELRNSDEFGVELTAERMRDDFGVKTVNAQVRDPRSGRGRKGAISFDVSFDSRSPVLAQKVANELASLYLEHNRRTRREAATHTTQFLDEETERLGAEVNELESKIATFKQAHMGRLPEQLDLNLRLMAGAERQRREMAQRIRSLEDRKIYLQSTMTQREANVQADTSATDSLSALRIELKRMLGIFTPEHPDVIRVRGEIEALETETGMRPGSTLLAQLDSRRVELASALERYTPQHPDVKKLEREVASLEAALGTAPRGTDASPGVAPEDPVYAELQVQQRTADNEIRMLQDQERELQAKIADFEVRIAEIPQIEREYSLLVRDRNSVLSKYHEIKAKSSSARVAQNLEKNRKGERFSLIELPRRPTRPYKPNRKKILALGLVGSVGAGVSTAILSEFLHKAVYGASAVTALLGVPPLAVIPYIENSLDRRRRRWKWAAVTLSCLLSLVAVVGFLHFQFMPLELIWAMLVERLDLLWDKLQARF